MFGSNVPAIPITAPIMGMGGNNNDGYGFGGMWWMWIILFAIFGWGRGGFGGNNNDCCCGTPATCADLQRGFDNQGVNNKLNSIENGLCSLGYDQLNQMNGINNAITQMGINNMQDTNALSRQLADCCCENRAAIAQVRYDNATNTCAITTSISNAARDIIESNNSNYRALDNRLTMMEMSRKDEKIAEQAQLINNLNLAVSQRNQNEYLIQQLRPCPSPAYVVPNPFCYNNNQNDCCCGRNACFN